MNIWRYLKKEIVKRKIWNEIKSLKDKRGFLKAGLPLFNQLFARDALISAWQLLNYNPGICQATLEILSRYQGKVFNQDREEEPGKILHQFDFKITDPKKARLVSYYYGSIDSTPLFLIIFSFYFEKTKDIKFLNRHWETILKAVNWMEENTRPFKDFFLRYEQKNPQGLFHQGWKDSKTNHLNIDPPVALVEVQGYQYLALVQIANLAKEKGDEELNKKLLQRADHLKRDFNEKFWMEDKNFYCLALNGKGDQRRAITSNPGHLLFTGIVNEDKIELVVNRLFQDDLYTHFGIRTHSCLEPDFNPRSYHLGSIWPHDNWIIAQGLKKIGKIEAYQKIKNALFLVFKKLGYLPEFYGVIDGKITLEMEKPPSYPQAWSSAALFNFLSDEIQ